MRFLLPACLLLTVVSVAACSTVAVTRTPDSAPDANKVVTVTQDTKDPGAQQSQAIVLGKWKLLSSSGGITGKTITDYKSHYYTFTVDSFTIMRDGIAERGKYEWQKVKDIHTDHHVYMMSGVGLVFTPVGKDTLHADMNAYDGYSYVLARVKQQ